MLRSSETRFLLVSGPGEERLADTMFFARHIMKDYNLLPRFIVNRVHPLVSYDGDPTDEAGRLLRWLGERDLRGLEKLRELVPAWSVIPVPLLPRAPIDLNDLESLSRLILGND